MIELQQWDILLRLILAHVLCDFIFQTDSMSLKKEKRDFHSHIFHSLLHANIAYILAFQWRAWYIWPVILITHGVIDYLKTYIRKDTYLFVIDQLLHLLVIFFLWVAMTDQWLPLKTSGLFLLSNTNVWIVIIGYALLMKPSSIFLTLFTRRWSEDGSVGGSLKNAGQSIGYLERSLIFVFILLNHFEAVGFLLAAKSIFRFGELSNAKEVKFTEYVLIGTFASFTLAIIIGLVTRYLLLN